METWFVHAGMRILVTTADVYAESKVPEAIWNRADVIIRVDDRGAKIIRGVAE